RWRYWPTGSRRSGDDAEVHSLMSELHKLEPQREGLEPAVEIWRAACRVTHQFLKSTRTGLLLRVQRDASLRRSCRGGGTNQAHREESPLRTWAGATVLVTGVTGFLVRSLVDLRARVV